MCKRDVSVRTWDPRDESKTKDGKVTHMILQVATANELCNFGQNVHRNKRREGAAQLAEGDHGERVVKGVSQIVHQRDENKVKNVEGYAHIPEGGGDVQIVQGVGQNVHQRDENKIKKGKVTHSLTNVKGVRMRVIVTKTKRKTWKVPHNLQVASVNELCKCEGCQSERGINVTKTKQKTGR
eukprot:TRINITY_DN1685_c0_g1_i10.p1 TRINITY_DN1685_c0_g1~~TRINITY_DN1685_c0_g1_i10.p1  ORF type:complete len:182 (+),score=16.93 TRINITY_DN1685_c0_g1_i10:155-700(+)